MRMRGIKEALGTWETSGLIGERVHVGGKGWQFHLGQTIQTFAIFRQIMHTENIPQVGLERR